jgi:hypothetical protein
MTMFASQWLANPGGYTIDQSIRFNDDDSAYLSRTPSSDGNLTTWTYSVWFKRSAVGSGGYTLMSAGADNTNDTLFYFGPANEAGTLDILFRESSSTQGRITSYSSSISSGRFFRDPSAWMHFVLVWDTTNSTSADRIRLYINGERATTDAFAITEPSLNDESRWNTARANLIGKMRDNATNYFDGYMAEVNFIDGQALTAASFGETNSDTGQWVPKAYSVSYGTNGFYLKFQDSSALGDDSSGNGNDFTSSGLAAADQMSDSPTDNHCTLNSLWVDGHTLSDGNLVASAAADSAAIGTMAFDVTDSDGFYFEAKVTTAATYPNVGIRTVESPSQVGAVTSLSGNSTGRYSFTGSDGNFNDAGSSSSYGSAWAGTADKVIGVLVKAGALYFSIDGTIQNSGTAAKTGLTGLMLPTVFYDAGSGTTAAWEMRFDASDWSTTPSGYKAISTANLPDPAIDDPSAYFQTTTYSGNGSSQSINQAGNSTFEPSMVWIKSRSATTDHVIQDQVRGNFVIYPNQSSAGGATGGGWVSSFDSDGFTVASNAPINDSGETFVGWQWAANGSGSSNEDGDLTATVSADSTSGFSIIKYQGTGSATTVGHGLGVAPKMVIVKDRDNSRSWNVYHDGLSAATKVIYLNQNVAESTDSAIFGSAPTSSVVNIATGGGSNGSGNDYIMYAFAEIEGFSKIDSYTGNGSSDGPHVITGFKPAWILVKNISSSSTNWDILDSTREPFNSVGNQLFANTNAAEASSDHEFDFLSNGFKARDTSSSVNTSGGTYIYIAFASSPFKTANAQ